jgi:DNA repair photolyase
MKVGVTERGDAGIDFSWADKLLDVNIIISKNLNDSLISLLLKNKPKIIFHMTCTGMGGTVIEPNVPGLVSTYWNVMRLIESGFPPRQIVLRVDPIVPTMKGIFTADRVLRNFVDSGVKRVRYSFLDMYPHVADRFAKADVKIPYTSFCAPQRMIEDALKMLSNWESIYEFEACTENTPHQLGCISKKDFDILGINYDPAVGGFQRPGCLCIAGKTELLTSKRRCPNGCLYCYWRD